MVVAGDVRGVHVAVDCVCQVAMAIVAGFKCVDASPPESDHLQNGMRDSLRCSLGGGLQRAGRRIILKVGPEAVKAADDHDGATPNITVADFSNLQAAEGGTLGLVRMCCLLKEASPPLL